MFHRTPFILPLLYPQLLWRVQTRSKELYLTFDDGPVPGPTEFVLDTLKKYSVPATFFCIGDNIQKHPVIFRQILSEGHIVANHTFNHLNGWKTDHDTYLKNVLECMNMINSIANCLLPPDSYREAYWFRPPYGRITRKQIKNLSQYKIVMWDVLTYDYSSRISPETCLKKSIRATRPGSVIVFHDSLKAEKNMTFALPAYIQYFLDKGYIFKRLE